eukprot:2781567-Rhodomonas_salina.2
MKPPRGLANFLPTAPCSMPPGCVGATTSPAPPVAQCIHSIEGRTAQVPAADQVQIRQEERSLAMISSRSSAALHRASVLDSPRADLQPS